MIHYYVIDYNNIIIIVWSDRLTHLLLTDYPTNKAEKYMQYGLLSNNVLEERTKGETTITYTQRRNAGKCEGEKRRLLRSRRAHAATHEPRTSNVQHHTTIPTTAEG